MAEIYRLVCVVYTEAKIVPVYYFCYESRVFRSEKLERL